MQTKGYLGCFQVLAIVNKAAINTCGHVFVWMLVFYSFGYILRNPITGSYAKNIYFLFKTAQSPFKVAIPFCIPTSNECCSYYSIPLPAVGVACVLNFDHSKM